MFIALATVNAQERQDTTQTQQQTQTESSTSSIGKSYEWRDEDREMLNREDLPSGLVETLKSDDYKGWENATIYRNKTSNEYMLVIQEGSDVKTFYFDQEGKALPESPEGSGTSTGYQTDSTSQSQTQGQTGNQTETGTWSGSSSSGSQGSSTTGSDSTMTGGSSSGSTTTGTDMSSDDSSMNTGSTQTDTTGTGSSTDYSGTSSSGMESDTTTNPTSTGSTTTSGSQSGTEMQSTDASTTSGAPTAWKTEDRVMITTNDLPSSLLITLGDPMYRGWENSSVYRNRSTNEYMIEIRDGSDTRTYYFDKDGKAVVNTSGSDDDDQK